MKLELIDVFNFSVFLAANTFPRTPLDDFVFDAHTCSHSNEMFSSKMCTYTDTLRPCVMSCVPAMKFKQINQNATTQSCGCLVDRPGHSLAAFASF